MDVFRPVQPIDPLNEADYSKTFSSFNKPIAIKGVKGEILYMNEQAKVLAEISQNDIFISYDEKLSDDMAALNELGLISIEKKLELKPINGNIKEKFFHIESITLFNKFGLFYGTIFIFHDLTAIARYLLDNRNINGNKAYDETTGFLLKNQFDEMLAREIERAIRYGFPLSIAVFFFENLVFFGQSLGNDKLSQLLKFYGTYFKQKFRKTDVIFRTDYNDFICILPHTDYERGNNKFMDLKKRLESAMEFKIDVKPILRYGISEFDVKKHYKNYGILVEEAKIDLQYKKNG